MEGFKKGDFVKVNDKEIGIVAGECGNLLRIRLNNMAEILCNPRLDGQKIEKINGVCGPAYLDDAEVRKNLRNAWLTINVDEEIWELQISGFVKPADEDQWYAVICVDSVGKNWALTAYSLMDKALIDGLPVMAVEER